jgi:SET domain-containing protein
MEDIPAYTLICEYACDILPMTCAQHLVYKDHVMFYANGKNSEEELILAPYNCSNWGPLINYDKTGNCATLRIVINRQIRVLIYSKQKIKKHEQLLYNYNSEVNEYPTKGFVDLKK